MRILLWDVDGTLVRNSERAGTYYHDAIREVAGVGPGPDEPHAVEHGKTDAQILTERLARWGGDPALLDAVSRRLDELSDVYRTDAERRTAAPGVDAALAATLDAGWRNALLTGNSRRRAEAKLAGAGLDAAAFDWAHSYFGDRTPVRADLARAAARDLAGSSAVIVGDTPADGEAADAARLPFAAVATGAFDERRLRTTSAFVVVPDLERGLDAFLAALARRCVTSARARPRRARR